MSASEFGILDFVFYNFTPDIHRNEKYYTAKLQEILQDESNLKSIHTLIQSKITKFCKALNETLKKKNIF